MNTWIDYNKNVRQGSDLTHVIGFIDSFKTKYKDFLNRENTEGAWNIE